MFTSDNSQASTSSHVYGLTINTISNYTLAIATQQIIKDYGITEYLQGLDSDIDSDFIATGGSFESYITTDTDGINFLNIDAGFYFCKPKICIPIVVSKN